MSTQVEVLEQFFRRREASNSDDDGDDNQFGEYWEPKENQRVQNWTITLVPMTDYFQLKTLYSGNSVYSPLSSNERIVDISNDGSDCVLIHCVTTDDTKYMFTVVMNLITSPFSLFELSESLINSNFETLIARTERRAENTQSTPTESRLKRQS